MRTKSAPFARNLVRSLSSPGREDRYGFRGAASLVGPLGSTGLRVKVDNRHVQSGKLCGNGKVHGDGRFPSPAFLTHNRHDFHSHVLVLSTIQQFTLSHVVIHHNVKSQSFN
jgi:hypothetical protein